MLTRLKIHGFKNLLDVDLRFGPFTCLVGPNGVGKSNLFDAISFLSDLSEHTLGEAARRVRGGVRRGWGVDSLFCLAGLEPMEQMSFEAEMLIPSHGVDRLGQVAEATTTFLRYGLVIKRSGQGLEIEREVLEPIGQRGVQRHLLFPCSSQWRDSVVLDRAPRGGKLISTDRRRGAIRLHRERDLESGSGPAHEQEGHEGHLQAREHEAARLPRTVLSDATAAESPTAALVREEMRSWRWLRLEPSALRRSDDFTTAGHLTENGGHLAATLARLAKVRMEPGFELVSEVAEEDPETAQVFAELATSLSGLLPETRSLRIDVDPAREQLTLMLEELSGIEHPAAALSDGSLRFLALGVLALDPLSRGLLCLEEPENGLHPRAIPAMLELLQDMAVDPLRPVDEFNPLRQLIANTYSPTVAAQVSEESLLMVSSASRRVNGRVISCPLFQFLSSTWRARADSEARPMAPGELIAFLQPVGRSFPELDDELGSGAEPQPRRVVDRAELQSFLLGSEAPRPPRG